MNKACYSANLDMLAIAEKESTQISFYSPFDWKRYKDIQVQIDVAKFNEPKSKEEKE